MKKFITMALVATLIAPTLSFAYQGNDDIKPDDRRPKAVLERIGQKKPEDRPIKNTCAELDTIKARFDESIVKFQEQITNRTTNQGKAIKEEKVTQERKNWDEKRSLGYEKMLERTTDDDKKAAIIAFRQAVESAVAEKRSALDALHRTRVTTMNNHLKTVETQIAVAVAALTQAGETAFAVAQDACESDLANREIVTTLQESLRGAQQSFKQTVQPLLIPKDTVQEVNADRKEEMQTILNAFKDAINQAKTELEQAFAKTTDIE